MGSCASSSISIQSARSYKPSANKDSDISLRFENHKSILSGSHQSQKDIDAHKSVDIPNDVCGESKMIEKVQATSIDRKSGVIKINILDDSYSDEQRIAFRYSDLGIGYDVPELTSPQKSSILKRREKQAVYSRGASTTDCSPKACIRQKAMALNEPLRPYVSKAPKFIR